MPMRGNPIERVFSLIIISEKTGQISCFIIFDQIQKKKMLKKNQLNLAPRKNLSNDKDSRILNFTGSQSSEKPKLCKKESFSKENAPRRKSIHMTADKLSQKLNNQKGKGKSAFRLHLSSGSLRKQGINLSQVSLMVHAELEAVRQILREEIINLLMESKILQKGYSNHVTLGLETLLTIFEKIVQCFFEEDCQSKQSQLSFLNLSLSKVKKIILRHLNLQKVKKLKIQHHLKYNFGMKQYSENTSILKSQIQSLLSQKLSLNTQLQELQAKKINITNAVAEKKHELLQENDRIVNIRRDLEQSRQQIRTITRNLQEMRENLKKTEQQYFSIAHFVDNENKNKLVQMASKDYKEIESDIYEFAVYLQSNELASSMMYESIATKNQNFVIEHLQQSLKQLNRTLIGNCVMSLEQKGKLMRNFVLNINQQYHKKDEQQQKLIQFKTKCIRKYVSMMQRWLSNWTLKQQFLVNLRKQFANIAISLSQSIRVLFESTLCQSCTNNCAILKVEICSTIEHLKQNYSLGNSFY